jgi:hypothetical protein
LQRRIILAATALAAALVVPTLASATDKVVGPGDRGITEAMQNRLQGGSNSQNQMAVGGPGQGSNGSNSQIQMAVGGHGHGSNDATVGQIGGTPTGQVGSTPTGTGVGQAGGNGATESPLACGSVKSKTPKHGPADEPKSSKLPKDDHTKSSKLPKGDADELEQEIGAQQELMDQLIDLLNQSHQRQKDVIRASAGG